MRKINVCVLFGGISPEHEVSLRSAESVLNHLDKDKYNIFPVGITKEGNWILYGGTVYTDRKAAVPAGGYIGYKDLLKEIFNFIKTGKEPISREET